MNSLTIQNQNLYDLRDFTMAIKSFHFLATVLLEFCLNIKMKWNIEFKDTSTIYYGIYKYIYRC